MNNQINNQINKFLEEVEGVWQVKDAVDNILKLFKVNDGKITSNQFDAALARYSVVNGELALCKYIAYPPIWFMCENSDINHAWHLNILQDLCSAEIVNAKTVRDGLPISSINSGNTIIKYTLEGFDNE